MSTLFRILPISLVAASAGLVAGGGARPVTSPAPDAAESQLILDWNRFGQQIITAVNGSKITPSRSDSVPNCSHSKLC